MRKFVLISGLLFFIYGHCQVPSMAIDSIINKHLNEFRAFTENDADILIDFDYNFQESQVELDKNNYVLDFNINPKKLDKKPNVYMVRFLLENKGGRVILKAFNFRVKKISRKKVEFINLMNGHVYEIIPAVDEEKK